MATLAMTMQDMVGDVLQYRVQETYATASAANKADALRLLNHGYRRALRAGYMDSDGPAQHRWTFLEPATSIVLWAASSSTLDGAPTGSGPSTVTVDDAIFYDTMIGHTLTIGLNTYTIATVTNTKVCTVTEDASGEVDETACSLTPPGWYPLPADWGGMVDPPAYQYTEGDEVNIELNRCSPETIRASWRTAQGADDTDEPTDYAVEPTTHVDTTGTRWRLLVYPIPDQNRTLAYRYAVTPAAIEDSITKYPYGGPLIADLIVTAAKAYAEKEVGDTAGVWEGMYQATLGECIAWDRNAMGESPTEQLTDVDTGLSV